MKQSMAVNLTKELIQIESTDPGTFEKNIEVYLHQWLSSLPNIHISEEEVLPQRYNLMAEIPGNPELPAIIFICHMDTVVVGDGWTIPPFDAIEKDGKIFGRGACDMKSGLACCLSAFASAAERAAKAPVLPKRTLRLICSVDEEDFMRGSEACIKSKWVSYNDWILDAEPTNGQIQVAHKGRIWFEIEVTGHTAHASTPWKGADAIAAMAEIIRFIHDAFANSPVHPDLGKSTVTFGQITGGYRPYVVPDSCKVWIDMRLVPPLNAESVTEIVQKAIAYAEKQIEGTSGSYIITGNRPYIEKDEQSPLLATLKKICKNVTGYSPVISYFPGYTDTAVIAGTLGNHNCMSYGPGNLECAHQPDEWVHIQDIIRCEQVYHEIANSIFES